MTRDGLYAQTTADVSERQAISDAVRIDVRSDGPTRSLSHMPVQILRMQLNDAGIGGGRYLCIWEPGGGIDIHNPKQDIPTIYDLIAVADNDGSLARRWSQNQAEGRPGGPLALPEDLVDDKRHASFEDWAVAVEESFLKRPHPNARDDMKTWRAECIAHQLWRGNDMTNCKCGDSDCPTFQKATEMANRRRAKMEAGFADNC